MHPLKDLKFKLLKTFLRKSWEDFYSDIIKAAISNRYVKKASRSDKKKGAEILKTAVEEKEEKEKERFAEVMKKYREGMIQETEMLFSLLTKSHSKRNHLRPSFLQSFTTSKSC